MWIPFISKPKPLEESEAVLSLSDEEKEFFLKENTKLEIEAKHAEQSTTSKVSQKSVLSKFKPAETPQEILELENYSSEKTLRVAVLENCSEVQQLLLQCLKTGGFRERISMCSDRSSAVFNCVDMQKHSLKRLGYDSARSIAEKQYIQGKSDDLFMAHFGREGLKVSDETVDAFKEAVEQTRLDFWG